MRREERNSAEPRRHFTFLGSVGILAQLVPVPVARGRRVVRLTAWQVGWLVWPLAGPASILHDLS